MSLWRWRMGASVSLCHVSTEMAERSRKHLRVSFTRSSSWAKIIGIPDRLLNTQPARSSSSYPGPLFSVCLRSLETNVKQTSSAQYSPYSAHAPHSCGTSQQIFSVFPEVCRGIELLSVWPAVQLCAIAQHSHIEADTSLLACTGFEECSFPGFHFWYRSAEAFEIGLF